MRQHNSSVRPHTVLLWIRSFHLFKIKKISSITLPSLYFRLRSIPPLPLPPRKTALCPERPPENHFISSRRERRSFSGVLPSLLHTVVVLTSTRIAVEMSSEELLQIEPQELQFAFELRKQISCSMQLTNKGDNYIAFKVKTTNPKKYCVRPNTGIVLPHSSCDVTVTMQAQKEAPTELQCKDKFLVQCVIVPPGTTTKDITTNMFNKEEGHIVEESKLKVTYIPPPQPPSPVHEGSEEGSSPRASLSDNGTVLTSELNTRTASVTETAAPRSRFDSSGMKSTTELQDNSSELKALIAKLTEEKSLALQQKNKLQQEVELLRRESSKNQAGIPLMYVIIVGLIGLLLGYILKK